MRAALRVGRGPSIAVVLLLLAGSVSADAGTINHLTQLLTGSTSFKIRATAAVALGRLQDNEAIAPLVGALETDRHYAVRAAAASALGRVHRIEAVKPLLAALRDDDPDVRDAAGASLELYHRPEFLPGFRSAVGNDTSEVREAAVRAYAEALRIGTSTAADVVFAALGDDDEAIRELARRAIKTLDHEKGLATLHTCLEEAESEGRAACAGMLAKRIDERSVDPLFAIVSDPAERTDVRRSALSAMRLHKVHVDIASTLKSAQASGDDQLKSIRLLGAVRDGFEVINKGLASNKDPLRTASARAMADFGGPKAKAAMTKAVARERDPRVKKQMELLLRSMR